MKRRNSTTERDEIEADLALLESLRWSKKEFFDRICQESRSQDDKILSVLRLEPTYQFAEFYYLLRARRIETEDDIQRLGNDSNSSHRKRDGGRNRADRVSEGRATAQIEEHRILSRREPLCCRTFSALNPSRGCSR